MSNKILGSLVILLSVAVLALLVVNIVNPKKKENTVEEVQRDTVIVYKTDTIVEYEVKYKEKKVTDTVWIEKENVSIPLVVVQKFYQNKGVYDLWISGVEPLKVDSINLYRQKEYITVTNVVDNDKYGVYVGGGLFSFRETLTPYASISLSTPKKWLISANFGLNGYLGVSVEYKIFEYGKRHKK